MSQTTSDDLDTALALKGILTAARQKICLAMAYSHRSRPFVPCHSLLINLRNDLDVILHKVEEEYGRIVDESYRTTDQKAQPVRGEQSC